MKTINKNGYWLLCRIVHLLFFVLMASSCEQQDPVVIKKSGARYGGDPSFIQCPDGQHWDNTLRTCVDDTEDPGNGVDCSVFYSGNIMTAQRDRTQTIYGSNGTYDFDNVLQNLDLSTNTSGTYIYNYSPALHTYVTRLESAVANAGNSYIQDNRDGDYLNYDSSAFKSAILAQLNLIKTDADNDNSLSSNDREIINGAIQAVNSNFDYISSLIETHLDGEGNAVCFPNPGWYDSGNPSSYGSKSGVVTNGFFRSLFKIAAKVVNIIATIVVDVIEVASYVAVYGAIVGALLPVVGVLTGLAAGAVIGGIIGVAKGINDCIGGTYVCVFSPCT